MTDSNRIVDRIVAVVIAISAVALHYLWSFEGVHPVAWDATAVAAGLIPQGDLLPGIGVYLSHLFFVILPFQTALSGSGLLSALLAAATTYLCYGALSRMIDLTTSPGGRDWCRRRLATRMAAGTATLFFACSDPMWHAAHGVTGASFDIFLVVLSCWLFTRFLECATYPMAVLTLCVLGLLSAETPLGWGLLVLFVFFTLRYLSGPKLPVWEDFLDPVRLQRTKWSMTFVFLAAFVFGILFECFAYAQLDGLRASGVTIGELPTLYVRNYFEVLIGAGSPFGVMLLVILVVVPLALSFMMIRPATDEERYLSFKDSTIYLISGGIAFMQLSPFAFAWFWCMGEGVAVSRTLQYFSALLSAMTVVWALFVLGVEIFCRNYKHIESVLFQHLHEDDDDGGRMDDEEYEDEPTLPRGRVIAALRPVEDVVGVRLTPGRLGMLVLPAALILIVVWGRRLPDDRELQRVVSTFVNETIDEADGVKYVFTDGSYDSFLRIESRRRGSAISPVSLMSGKSNREAYIRKLGTEGFEDRMSLETGASETLRTWVLSKSERLESVAVQLAFEYFRLNRRLKPTIYGLLVRPTNGRPEDAKASIERCHGLADRIVAIHESGVWRHAKDALLKDLFLFAQFRLAVMSRLRAIHLDTEKRVAESLAEIAYSDRLNANNPSLKRILRRMDWVRRQNGDELTPREGLEIALKRADFMMARRYAMPILREDSDEPNANFAVGMSYYAEEQFAKAEEFLLRVLKRMPKEPSVYNNLSLICLKTGRLEEAQKYIDQALELKPDQQEIKDTLRQIEEARKAREDPISRFKERTQE